MKRWLLISIFGTASFGMAFAAAAALTVNTSSLAAGNGTVSSCASNAVTVGPWTTSYVAGVPGHAVSAVSITLGGAGADATACNGKTLSVVLRDGSNASLGSGSDTVATGTNTYVVSISGSPAASAVVGTSIAIG